MTKQRLIEYRGSYGLDPREPYNLFSLVSYSYDSKKYASEKEKVKQFHDAMDERLRSMGKRSKLQVAMDISTGKILAPKLEETQAETGEIK